MDLKSPELMVLAWIVVPGGIAGISALIGSLVQRAAGMRLGALVLPVGFVAGIALMNLPIQAGLPVIAGLVLLVAAAVAGGVILVLERPRWRDWYRERGWMWAGAAALVAYFGGIAPVVGSGRIGLAGYVLNNDPSVHLSAIELLKQSGMSTDAAAGSSYHAVSGLFGSGYPLGSMMWPLAGSSLTGIDAFAIWTPVIAVAMAMLALTGYALLRSFDLPRWVASIGGLCSGAGFLQFSYLAQGGMKEIEIALAVYATAAVTFLAVRTRPDWRGFIPAAVCAGAAIDILGLGAGAWIGPVGIGVLVWLIASRRVNSAHGIGLVAGWGLAAALISLPAAIASASFLRASEHLLANPAQIGNLFTAVPWVEAFGIWLHPDYRNGDPAFPIIAWPLITTAIALGVVGVADAIRRRRFELPLLVLGVAAGTIYVSRRYAIYFDAKAYLMLAPAFAIASAVGIYALFQWRPTRYLGLLAGAAFALGIAASDAAVYAGVWNTPKARFQELIDVADRLKGRQPVLVHEREDYAKYFLRDSQPWESWGPWQPDRGLQVGSIPQQVPHTPDFDDYSPGHFHRFNVLVERKRAGGSRAPGSFEIEFETEHYRIWRRVSQPPMDRFFLGRDELDGQARLDCKRESIGRLFNRSHNLRAAFGGPAVKMSLGTSWLRQPFGWRPLWHPEFVERTEKFSYAFFRPELKDGEYDVWLRGSYASGFQIYIQQAMIGEVFGDLGLIDSWHRVGIINYFGDQSITLHGLARPSWMAGSKRPDLVGGIAFVRRGSKPRVESLRGDRAARKWCGKRLDWLEVVSTNV